MIFSSNKHKHLVYLVMAIFPFATHFYIGFQHILKLDFEFWICLVVCVFASWIFVMKKSNKIAKLIFPVPKYLYVECLKSFIHKVFFDKNIIKNDSKRLVIFVFNVYKSFFINIY